MVGKGKNRFPIAADKLRGKMDTAEYKHIVQSEKFVAAHGGRIGDIAIYVQESNPITWKLAKLNLAIRQIESNLGKEHADAFHNDRHPNLRGAIPALVFGEQP